MKATSSVRKKTNGPVTRIKSKIPKAAPKKPPAEKHVHAYDHKAMPGTGMHKDPHPMPRMAKSATHAHSKKRPEKK